MKYFLLFTSILISFSIAAQDQYADTIKTNLSEVVVTGYLSRQPLAKVPASVAVLDIKSLRTGHQQSLVPVVNAVPGVRMEERSPGSYRLSIRGSLLRSPFGVRNVKMYLNDLPLTDASGNTYLNLIDPAFLQRMEILKGPDGSLFGANSGGVVLMDLSQSDSLNVRGTVSGGSYGLFRGHVVATGGSEKINWSAGGAYQRSDGYREQSALKRFSAFGSGKFKYGFANSVKHTMLFSNIQYETPGGLTKAQFEENPKLARLPTPQAPGAIEQQTGIENTTFFQGITNELAISKSIKHIASIFETYTRFENPAISNYEIRNEKNRGIRTYFSFLKENRSTVFNFYVGLEGQWGSQKFYTYDNNGGARGDLDSADHVRIRQLVYFTRLTLDIADRLTTEFSVSLNQNQYEFDGFEKRNLSQEWMPRVALSYQILPEFALRASVSRGYSPPTIAEIRPSGGTINQILEAESGWNKEIGFRFSTPNGRLQTDASVCRYDLTNALVRRTTDEDTEYFLNAGGTKQTGVELLVNAILINQPTGFLRTMGMNVGYTYSRFVFEDYVSELEDYSGNRLTGVPRTNLVTGLSVDLSQRLNIFIQSMFVSRVPLNDGNEEYADDYQLLHARIGWTIVTRDKLSLELFAGGDNLLNQKYSLGNDLNAAGGRYYNAAPLNNFYGGLNLAFR